MKQIKYEDLTDTQKKAEERNKLEDKLIELLREIDSNDKEAIILIVSYGRQKGCTKEIIKFIERNKKANFEDIVAFCYCYGKNKLPND